MTLAAKERMPNVVEKKDIHIVTTAALYCAERRHCPSTRCSSAQRVGCRRHAKYTMRVPDEKNTPTVRMEAEFPEAVEVISVDPKEGWKIELKKDSSGKLAGAIWSGGSIAPNDIAEFGFQARNPTEETKLVWKVIQVYADGTKSEWTGPAGSRSPAPVTHVKPK